MATDRVIGPSAAPHDEQANWALRPATIDEYIGQSELIERITIAIRAAQGRKDPLEHVLLHGPPGLGKTTLAHVLAQEMGTKLHVTSGPALAKGTDLVSCLTRLQAGDLLFIDEIHRLPIAVEEFIYPAMEDFRVDVTIDSGLSARTVQIRCKPFTLVGATTRAGLISAPLRSRFGIVHHLRYYSHAELVAILARSARLLNMPSAPQASIDAIAARSRGTPRIANRLLRRIRDFSQVRAKGELSTKVVADALKLEGVDELGLDELDRSFLRIIATTYRCGPVGLEAIAATMNEDSGTLEDVVEPFLLQIGFLARTRRGRSVTPKACEHLGLPWQQPPENSSLFG